MSVEAQVRYSQFDEKSETSTYELDDDEYRSRLTEAEDLELDGRCRTHRARSPRHPSTGRFPATCRSRRNGGRGASRSAPPASSRAASFGQTIGEDLNDEEDASTGRQRIQLSRKPPRRIRARRVQIRGESRPRPASAPNIPRPSRGSGRTSPKTMTRTASVKRIPPQPVGAHPGRRSATDRSSGPASRAPCAGPISTRSCRSSDSTIPKTMTSPSAIRTSSSKPPGASTSASSSGSRAASSASTSSIARFAT